MGYKAKRIYLTSLYTGSSFVLQTRLSSVVLPAFALPITRIRKWVYLARIFAASNGSIDTAVGARSAKISWMRIRAASRRRAQSEHLLQAIAKSLQFGLFSSLRRALVSHMISMREKTSLRSSTGLHGITPHNRLTTSTNRPPIHCCQLVKHTDS